MKIFKYCLICFFTLFILNSCGETVFITEVTILNKSSYDLHIDFETKYEVPSLGIKQNKSNSFILEISMSGSHLNPNHEIEKII